MHTQVATRFIIIIIISTTKYSCCESTTWHRNRFIGQNINHATKIINIKHLPVTLIQQIPISHESKQYAFIRMYCNFWLKRYEHYSFVLIDHHWTKSCFQVSLLVSTA